jgi:hypothetical protein
MLDAFTGAYRGIRTGVGLAWRVVGRGLGGFETDIIKALCFSFSHPTAAEFLPPPATERVHAEQSVDAGRAGDNYMVNRARPGCQAWQGSTGLVQRYGTVPDGRAMSA